MDIIKRELTTRTNEASQSVLPERDFHLKGRRSPLRMSAIQEGPGIPALQYHDSLLTHILKETASSQRAKTKAWIFYGQITKQKRIVGVWRTVMAKSSVPPLKSPAIVEFVKRWALTDSASRVIFR